MFSSHSFMQFVCVNVHMYMCVYTNIFIHTNIYIHSYTYIYNPCRLLILIASFHLINSLWSLKFIWKYTMSSIFPIILGFLFPFLISMFVQKTILSLPRSQSFFLCAFRKNKGPSEMEDTEDKWENTVKIENGIPCDPLDMKGGHVNDAFVTEDERLTPLWRAAVLFPPETQHLFLCNCWTSQFIEGRLYILFHHSSFVRNFECAWNWKAMNYTHEDHWNNKLLTIQNILKYFSDSTVCKCSHVAFVVTDFKMH